MQPYASLSCAADKLIARTLLHKQRDKSFIIIHAKDVAHVEFFLRARGQCGIVLLLLLLQVPIWEKKE